MLNLKLNDKTNIFLKDFPARLSEAQLIDRMAENVKISWAKNLPTPKRKDVLQTLPQDWFYANTYINPIYDSLRDTLYQRYRYCHQDNFIPILNATREWYENADKIGYQPPFINDYQVDGFSIIGVSGVGKTYCTKQILRKCFDQLVKRDNTIQITWLMTNCVDTPSLKQLIVNFLAAVDNLTGENYVKDYLTHKTSPHRLQALAANVAARHHIGVWLIDEVHHLKSIPFRSAEQIINFLKNISAAIGLPIIYIGTPEAISILGKNFQIARRAEGNGSIFWGRYKRTLDTKDCLEDLYNEEDEFDDLMESLWKRQVLRKSGSLTKELKDAYYNKSQGIMKRVIAIHVRAQVIALTDREEKITVEIINKAARDFQLTENMINALASGKSEFVADYPDLSMRSVNTVNEIANRSLSPRDVVEMILDNDYSTEEAKMLMKVLMEKYRIDNDGTKTGNKKMRPPKAKNSKPTKTSARRETLKKGGDLVEKTKAKASKEEIHTMLNELGMTGLDSSLNS